MTNPDHILEAVKATPPATVLAFSIFGYSLGEWTSLLAFILIVAQLFFLFKEKVWDKRRKDKDGKS